MFIYFTKFAYSLLGINFLSNKRKRFFWGRSIHCTIHGISLWAWNNFYLRDRIISLYRTLDLMTASLRYDEKKFQWFCTVEKSLFDWSFRIRSLFILKWNNWNCIIKKRVRFGEVFVKKIFFLEILFVVFCFSQNKKIEMSQTKPLITT